MHLPFDPAILLLGISPVDVLAHALIDLCTKLFITVLFVTVKNWKQSKGLSIKNWLNKLKCIHEMEYYATKKEWCIYYIERSSRYMSITNWKNKMQNSMYGILSFLRTKRNQIRTYFFICVFIKKCCTNA